MERYRNPETLSPQQEYLRTLTTVNNLCQEAQLRPMFVGGVIAKAIHLGNIGQMKMDFAKRTAYVPTTTAQYTAPRKDGTVDDFDIILNNPDKHLVEETVVRIDESLKAQGLVHHFVSTEAVRYPGWRSRNKIFQMVSGIDVDESGCAHFSFGSTVSKPISEESLQPWTYVMEEEGKEIIRLPSFGPAYFGFRYLMRLPVAGSGGLRQKDRIQKIDEDTGHRTTKIHTLMTLRRKAIENGALQGYAPDDEAWRQFIVDLQHPKHQDALTHAKSEFFHFYWETMGPLATAIAHGKGVFEEVAKLGNKFTG